MTTTEVFSMLGGIGLFLFGMTVMSSGLRSACGDNLQVILEKATTNKVTAVLVGLALTILVQSSSATDIMVIGFVNAGMMNLAQAIGVIMGANIGTTVTAQITAFNLAAYAPVLLFFGVVAYLFVKKAIIKHIGEFVMGFGMLFLGISIMKGAIAPLAQSEEFVRIISGLDNPFLAVLFGVAFTALLQSSSSSTVIFQTFAVEGILSYHTAVYLVIGAAIGSVTPNLIASLTTNRNGKRTAILNLVFNLIRACILMAIITAFPGILDFIQSLSPESIGRQIANTHTIFALTAVLIQLPFTKYIIAIAEKIIPVLPDENEKLEDRKLMYMFNMRNMPTSVALAQAKREILRMGRLSAKNLRGAINCFFDYDAYEADKVRGREESVDILNKAIDAAIIDLRSLELSENSLIQLSSMAIASTDIERLSDHAENIVEYIEEMRGKKAQMSEAAIEELKQMAEDTINCVDMALDIFESEDYSYVDQIEDLEDKVDEQQVRLVNNHVERLMTKGCDPLAGVIFTNLVTDLERCSDHAINIAYALKHDRD